MRVLIIGGTGAFAGWLTELCLERGDDVMVVTRGQRELAVPDAAPGCLTALRTDRADLADHRGELDAFAPDAVVDVICFQPEHAQQLLDLFAQVRRVVMISSVDVYGEDVGASLVTEERTPAPATPYARGKHAAEQILIEGLGSAATVVRPSHILGRGFKTAGLWGRTEHVLARVRAGLPICVLDEGRGVMTPVWAGDLAALVRSTLDTPAADGEILNGVGREQITQRRYFTALAEHVGMPLRLVSVPSSVVRRSLDTGHQFAFHRPYSLDKAIRLLGHEPRYGIEQMMAETIDALPVHDLGSPQLPAEIAAASAAEDRIIRTVHRHDHELGALLRELP